MEVRDHEECVQRLPAFKDKRSSEEFGRRLEKLIACRAVGERPTGELALWLESLPKAIMEKLLRRGILDSKHAAASKPLSEHLRDWSTALSAKGDCKSHVKQEVSKVARIAKGCRFGKWSDISASRLEAYLADLRRSQGMSIRTSNGYLGAFRTFVRWAVRDGHAPEGPLMLQDHGDLVRFRNIWYRPLTN